MGGFFVNPESEMLARWYRVDTFSPFLRARAHIDTKRRIPYLSEEPYKSNVREALRLQYSMLPVWCTAFRASVAGLSAQLKLGHGAAYSLYSTAKAPTGDYGDRIPGYALCHACVVVRRSLTWARGSDRPHGQSRGRCCFSLP